MFGLQIATVFFLAGKNSIRNSLSNNFIEVLLLFVFVYYVENGNKIKVWSTCKSSNFVFTRFYLTPTLLTFTFIQAPLSDWVVNNVGWTACVNKSIK